MRKSALSAAVTVIAATIAGAAAPARAATAEHSKIKLEAGAGNHLNTGSVIYKPVGAPNALKILTVRATGAQDDCAWIEWNEPGFGWRRLTSEPSCGGTTVVETTDRVISANDGYQIKVRLVAYHGSELAHKDVENLG
ncbi:hypothetical protein QLQ12_28830 [Actinoplanes sp. NEAU-A12]|uniref:Secreted protein n=1 Tax=Actinoplanes sandaracinus TaxID=3045177 RepID=A0ABT6WSE6_9ACTN|nr:hypothetical protein [Actinoplanes sandaracinus]MDI6102634.1 hypothetical protein [Actinoplanes sandaracinus]